MFNCIKILRFEVTLLFWLLALACTPLLAQPAQVGGSLGSSDRNPGKGVRILKVDQGSPAERAGLQPMDLLTRYGEFEIVDHANFFAARDAYEKSPETSVQVVIWRGNTRLAPTVPTGRLGIDTNEYNPVSYQFDSLMQHINVTLEIPEYMRDREFKDSYTSPEKLVKEARALLDRAAEAGTLTPAQLLVARIYVTLDDAPPEDLKKQSELLAQLCSTQPDSYIIYLGQDLFFEKKRYRAAIECFKHYLRIDPSDVSIRLNLGVACYHQGMFDEADAAADYVLDNKLGLSEHGFLVAYQVKAVAALGHRDYLKSIFYAEKSFELNRCTFDVSLVQFAAAQIGDLEKLDDASRKFRQVLPAEYEKRKYQVDAVKAFALAKINQRDQARQLILKWKDADRIEGKLNRYWGVYPGGSDVVKSWKKLMKD